MGSIRCVKGCNMQEKKILPRRKGVVLLSVLGCLFVFLQKQKKTWHLRKHPVDGRLHRKYFAVDGSAGVPSGISWNLGGASTLEPGTDRRRHREKAGCMVCPPFRLAAAPLRCADIFGSLLFLLLAWLPVYLAYYPGICAYDARCRRDRSWNIIISIITPLCTLCFCRGCCGWEVISSAV